MTDGLSAQDAHATAHSAGLPVSEETARRIAIALSPAFRGFFPVAVTLSFDLEPAAFQRIQHSRSTPEGTP